MRFLRHIQRLLGVVLVALLLFTQAAFATQPCIESGMSAAAALGSPSGHDCCGTSLKQVNLCIAKCTEGAQLSAHVPLCTPSASTEPILILPIVDRHAAGERYWRSTALPDPPKTVRLCTLLI
jgi:hypothetical protein